MCEFYLNLDKKQVEELCVENDKPHNYIKTANPAHKILARFYRQKTVKYLKKNRALKEAIYKGIRLYSIKTSLFRKYLEEAIKKDDCFLITF